MYDPKDRKMNESLARIQKRTQRKGKIWRLAVTQKMKDLLQRYEEGEDIYEILEELPYGWKIATKFEPGSEGYHDAVQYHLDAVFAPYKAGFDEDDDKTADDEK